MPSTPPPSRLRTTAQAVLDVVFPPICSACGSTTTERESAMRGFCLACESELCTNTGPVCLGCATPSPSCEEEAARLWPLDCPACREQKWVFDEVIALDKYDGLLRHLVLQGKHSSGAHGCCAMGRLLAQQQAERFVPLVAGPSKVEIVPVPSHWSRRLARGGNGPDAIAAGLAEGLGVRFHRRLRRVRATDRQTSIAPSSREANVRGAFQAKLPKRSQGATFLLVDDVLTTGATAQSAARALLRSRAGRVVVVVAAKRLATL